eukprot:TRINITY_DN5561_c0_g1_i1.p1 TRINITY_DN5561_c0_g1~~TRINITY_DN5561_c0_g1_i1.p1  ORF type:complete len:267 (-),score=33.92 TRINITY_DN5561_c0_g1_i1:12-812(-)
MEDYSNITFTHKTGPLNVLLFGSSGMGKSSFINLFFSALQEKSVANKAKARALNKTTTETVTYQQYKLTPSISLWDTWGWTSASKTYKGSEFENMLSGKIPSGQHMTSLKPSHQMDYTSEIDVVVFVIDRSALSVKEDISEMKKFYDTTIEKGKKAIVAVTKIDLEDKNIHTITNPQVFCAHLQSLPKFKQIREFIWECWQNESIDVYPVVNYEFGTKLKNPCYEKTAQNILDGIIHDFSVEETHQTITPFDLYFGEHVSVGVYFQ